VSIFNYKSFNY